MVVNKRLFIPYGSIRVIGRFILKFRNHWIV
jgi:hypothetical protein